MKLQSASVTQYTDNSGKSDWHVMSGDQVLHSLPASLNESQVFSVLRFAREFEKMAFEQALNNQPSVKQLIAEAVAKKEAELRSEFYELSKGE